MTMGVMDDRWFKQPDLAAFSPTAQCSPAEDGVGSKAAPCV